jgi:hypothetical protein
MFNTRLEGTFDPSIAFGWETEYELTPAELRWKLFLQEIKRTTEGLGEAKLRTPFRVLVEREQEQEEEAKSSSWTTLAISSGLFAKHISGVSQLWKCHATVHNLVRLIRESSISHVQRIAERVEHLLAISIQEQPESCAMSSNSIKGFMKFLELHKNIRYPNLTLTPNGEIYAQWKRGRSLLGIQFLSDLDVKFVVFTPNPQHPEKTNRVSGSDTVDRIFENLEKIYAISNWVSQ